MFAVKMFNTIDEAREFLDDTDYDCYTPYDLKQLVIQALLVLKAEPDYMAYCSKFKVNPLI